MKTFYTQKNIGKVKYVISYHNGIATHKDGSPFFGVRIFSTKTKFEKSIKELLADGYVETN